MTGYLNVGLRERNLEGTDVKQGDLLFEIDPRPYQDDLNRAKASLNQAVNHRDRLTLEFNRAKTLLPGKGITQEEFDKAEGDLREAEAAVAMAQAALDQADRNLTWTKVTADFDGRVGRQSIDSGNIVKADDTVLTSLVALDPVYAYFDVDERTMLRSRRLLLAGKIKSMRESNQQQPVFVGLADEIDEKGIPRFPYKGTLDFVDNQVDPMSGTLRLRGEFANPHSEYNTLRIFSPGMFVRVRLPIGVPHTAVLISEEALGTDQGQSFVYVVNDKNVVEYRRVTMGMLEKGLRVIDEGLKPGERVVVKGLQQVRDKMPVQAELLEPPKAKAESKTAVPPAGTGEKT